MAQLLHRRQALAAAAKHEIQAARQRLARTLDPIDRELDQSFRRFAALLGPRRAQLFAGRTVLGCGEAGHARLTHSGPFAVVEDEAAALAAALRLGLTDLVLTQRTLDRLALARLLVARPRLARQLPGVRMVLQEELAFIAVALAGEPGVEEALAPDPALRIVMALLPLAAERAKPTLADPRT